MVEHQSTQSYKAADLLRKAMHEACEEFDSALLRLKQKLEADQSDKAIDAQFPEFLKIANALFEKLSQSEQTCRLDKRALQEVQKEFRSQRCLQPFYESPFNKAALKKRFNYAGDFEVIDLLMTSKVDSKGFQRLFDAYLVQLPAVRAIIERHEVLRTIYKEEQGQAWQLVKSAADWRMDIQQRENSD